jgi:cytochrome c biogenesis protein CcmG/thiol:disulfide interchange protein DsbE
MIRRLATFLSILILASFFISGCKKFDSGATDKAPDFVLKDLEGNDVKLSDFNKEKVIILDFWATWCGPCRWEIPHFVELYNEYGKDGVEIVGISVDRGGNAVEKVKNFASQHNVNYTLLMFTDKVVQDYGGIRSIPTTFVLDRNQMIYRKYVGYRSKDVFDKDIKDLLGKS